MSTNPPAPTVADGGQRWEKLRRQLPGTGDTGDTRYTHGGREIHTFLDLQIKLLFKTPISRNQNASMP